MQRFFLAAAVLFGSACESDHMQIPMGPGITLSPPSATIAVGDSVRFSVTVYNADHRARWTSSDQRVVTVDSIGFAHAKAPGTATVVVASVAQPDEKASGIVTVP